MAVALAACVGNRVVAQEGTLKVTNLDELRCAREKAKHRTRRIIFDNDGNEPVYYLKEATPEALLACRTTPLLGSHVDTIFYCTWSSPFGTFTHNTKVGEVLVKDPAGKVNVTGALIQQGTDPLREVIRFCHENDMEAFWSMRMNDTHDGAHRPDKPYLLFPPLKEEHPEYLIGSLSNRPKHGSWTSVDYTLPEVRELAFRFIEEVCRDYDVDGVDLDFFRHLSYFKTVALGGKATEAELEMMTGLLRRVREMADAVGRERGRPILIAVRVPDSAEYAKAMGLDIEQWMAEGIVDIVIGSGYFQLNDWEYLVELGRKHDTVVYAGLSESRVTGEAPPLRRGSTESYRARAMRAWQAGVDGIYIFNVYNAANQFLREIGEPETLQTLDKLYYVTIRNGGPGRYLTGGTDHQTVPILTPSDPLAVYAGDPQVIQWPIGDDVTWGQDQGVTPKIALHVLAANPESLQVRLNGGLLGDGVAAGSWTRYPVQPDLIKQGINRLELSSAQEAAPTAEADTWNIQYEATAKPKPPWALDRARANTLAEMRDDALFMADRGTEPGDYMYCHYAWNVRPQDETVAEARVKVVDGWNNILVHNGLCADRICLYPDHIALYHSRDISYAMDTTDDFHTYKVVLKDDDIQVYVDGTLRLDGTDKFTAPVSGNTNRVSFGAANSPETGEALWQSIKLRTQTVSVYDVALTIEYQQP